MDKLLIANRGEIAIRIIRAARSLGIKTAVVYSDADVSAAFVDAADEAVHLPGALSSETYLVGELLIEAATRVGADAIHPGYGFLSENAAFADACDAAGLVFVGPPADAIRRMGDKLEAKSLMAAHGVPVLHSVTLDHAGADAAESLLAGLELPAIVKATAGGGGRGMRIVERADELAAALASAQREALAAFGDATVFIEQYIQPARHIEVQVVADAYGVVATLFERECSIQRRHQKLVEEAPSPVVDPELRSRLTAAAARAAAAVDYRGVGTVEFVVDHKGDFAFLEMNTRLQVEHPVTEAVSGLDLVRLQLRIADGEPLARHLGEPTMRGHAIEVRLCAEDPAAGFLPSIGDLHLFEIDGPGIRVDTGVGSGSEVSPHYDSMIAKVIAWGETRTEAARLLADALERARIHGVTTNRDLLVRVLRSQAFLDGDTTTDFLDRVPGLFDPLTDDHAHRCHAVAAAIALQNDRQGERRVHAGLPAGWRNNRSSLEHIELSAAEQTIAVDYDLSTSQPTIHVDGTPIDVGIHRVSPASVEATIDGVRRRFDVHVVGDQVLVDSGLGASTLTIADRFPHTGAAAPQGSLTAPMPGRVVRVLVSKGDVVEVGDPLLVIEAMKMEHTVSSPAAGVVVVVNVQEGDQIERGAVLAEVEES